MSPNDGLSRAAGISQKVAEELGVRELVRERPSTLLVGPVCGVLVTALLSQWFGFAVVLSAALLTMFGSWTAALLLELRRIRKAGGELLVQAAACDQAIERSLPLLQPSELELLQRLAEQLEVALAARMGQAFAMPVADRLLVTQTLTDYLPGALEMHRRAQRLPGSHAQANLLLRRQLELMSAGLEHITGRVADGERAAAERFTRLLQARTRRE